MTNYAQFYPHTQIRETDVCDYFLMPAQRAGKQLTHPIQLPTRRLVHRAR